jgi:hypothetical protein
VDDVRSAAGAALTAPDREEWIEDPAVDFRAHAAARLVSTEPCYTRLLASQQDTRLADHFVGARKPYRAHQTLPFGSTCAAPHSADFVNHITHLAGDRMYVSGRALAEFDRQR